MLEAAPAAADAKADANEPRKQARKRSTAMGAAHLIIDGKAEFNAMESYYRMFPHEMSTESYWVHDLQPPVRIDKITYEKLLDKMIELRTNKPEIDHFVIVVHGLHDAKDFGWGLAMPMTDGAHMKCSYEVLDELLKLRDKNASQSALDEFEGRYSYSNKNLGLNNVTYPKGSVARIVDKMNRLQKLKVRWVELRACTLGTNKPGLEIVGQSFGARFAIAPDVHMFYVSIDVAMGFNKDPMYDKMLKLIPKARKFENPKNKAERLAIGIKRGGGVSFIPDTLTNSVKQKWFTDSMVYAQNSYVDAAPGAAKPKNFFIAGMDLLGGNYALPQEQVYRNHLISVGPLA